MAPELAIWLKPWALFGTKFKIIAGYKGKGGMNQGMEQGEAPAPHYIIEKKLKLIIQDGLKRDLILPYVWTFLELSKIKLEKGVLSW